MKYLKLTDLGYELKVDSSITLPDGCIELSDDDFKKLSGDDFIYKNGAIIPYVAPIPLPIIPASVTMEQARLALFNIGLLDQVEAEIAKKDKKANISWNFATVVKRDSPLVQDVKTVLGLTETDLDNLFLLASTL